MYRIAATSDPAALEKARRELLEFLLPVDDFAQVMGICRRTAHNYCTRGTPYIKIGKLRFVHTLKAREWTMAHLRAEAQAAPAPAALLPPRAPGRPKREKL